jgi:required for meiotic nuclear division protein 1
MATGYLMHAINLYDSFPIKTVRTLLSGKVIDSSPQELVVQYKEDAYAFIYRFGVIAFFNLSNLEMETEVKKIQASLGAGLDKPTSESYQITTGATSMKVEFETVDLKKFSLDQIRLVAMTVAQSAALEYFELAAERKVADNSSFMVNLAKSGRVPMHSKTLMKIIGSTASTRQHIFSNMSILDPPEETWKSQELEKLYRELQQNFDIEVRFRTLDRKLTLIQDNIEILADLATARRMTFLESSIVILIIVELALAFLHRSF